MSLHRRAAKRDDNEPEIRKAFARHGWHTETMSAPGMPDLLVWPRFKGAPLVEGRAWLVDVKAVDGKVTEPQREKWKALSEKGIPVYVCRTEADVDALVRGELEPWRPGTCGPACDAKLAGRGPDGFRRVVAALRREATPKGMGHAVEPLMREESSIKARARSGYTPPRSTPVDAAKEAAETFAPPAELVRDICAARVCYELPVLGTRFCPEHTP